MVDGLTGLNIFSLALLSRKLAASRCCYATTHPYLPCCARGVNHARVIQILPLIYRYIGIQPDTQCPSGDTGRSVFERCIEMIEVAPGVLVRNCAHACIGEASIDAIRSPSFRDALQIRMQGIQDIFASHFHEKLWTAYGSHIGR